MISAKKWHLIVNVGKTKIMKFGNNRQNQFYYDTQEIENIESFKYLGHVLTNKRNTKQTLGHITPKLALKMFDTYILPILEYNCEIWSSNKPVNELEKVQLGYLKNMLNLKSMRNVRKLC